ncbi:hypothetical protein FUA48_00610 [Flavobacterium alkalisoli]|uniref:Uncharacterized protein n=1 Tax=Flavobacterium alkalisoli TaxID=2602769 RepID=A0A5B9FP79_9FLAO|nr:hypothetical protein [Flavobacterium alkalisoli]QEE48129.1 hypothetical protein FUA48_00610 [Flavobacterium alkalisoli]
MLFKPLMPVAEYLIKYDYIAKELCENKAKPELHCNGKCHLMKELAKAAEDEKPVSQKKNSHQETEVLFCQSSLEFEFTPLYINTRKEVSVLYTNLYVYAGYSTVFHPPAFIS